MPLAQILIDFKGNVSQCEQLIANAHKADQLGIPIFPEVDRQQITVAGFLNMFRAWEGFLEASIIELMIGGATLGGNMPVRYVSPPDRSAAMALIIGVMRYFDYANHQNFKKITSMYFENGYPYEPHISAIFSELEDLRVMRNSSAHISSTTQVGLEGLALRIFGMPKNGITLYQLLTSTDPRSQAGETVFVSYRNKLVVTAELICQG